MGWARVSNLKRHPPTQYPPRPGPDAQSNKLRPRRVKWGATEASLQSRARSGAAARPRPITSSKLAPALPDQESTTCRQRAFPDGDIVSMYIVQALEVELPSRSLLCLAPRHLDWWYVSYGTAGCC